MITYILYNLSDIESMYVISTLTDLKKKIKEVVLLKIYYLLFVFTFIMND